MPEGLTQIPTFMLWVLAILIVLAPLPEGSAYPWALTVIEVLSFALIAVWQLGAAFSKGSWASFERARPLLLPALLFVALVLVQLTRLPPGLIRSVSPATYRLYELSLPGWSPKAPPERIALYSSPVARAQWNMSPKVTELARGATVPSAPPVVKVGKELNSSQPRPAIQVPSRWRTLSIAPSMSTGVLLELTAFGSLFFLVLLYPFGPPGSKTEERLSRTIVMAALWSGLIVAVVGVIEFFVWNGKILWLFVPYDWGSPQPGMPLRASGSFVNPDHFGDYLALVLPLAVGGALFPFDGFSKQRAIRVFCGVTAFLALCAMLLSLSRASWMGAALALAILIALSSRMPRAARPRVLSLGYGTLPRRACVLVFAAIALCLIFVGPQGRDQIDLRMQETVQSDSWIAGRFELDAETLAMVRDYPLLGVGLGCWPELFPHYRQPPWTNALYREAHNDYAELLAATGIVGFALVAWFFAVIAVRLKHSIAARSVPISPILAMLCASLAVTAFHEFFDFSLHTPANALVFTILLALLVRIATRSSVSPEGGLIPSARLRGVAVCISIVAIALIGCALAAEKLPYPYYIRSPESVRGALKLISAHPAESTPHLELVSSAGEGFSAQDRLRELHAAVWLDPTNPYARDLYARALLQQGMTVQALDNISWSVFASPSPSTHYYLDGRIISWLSGPQKAAVESGFRKAIQHRYDGAVVDLAEFYNTQDRFADAARTYSRAAEAERDPALRENYLVGAGVAYAQAGNLMSAETFLKKAIADQAADERPYRYLITLVLGPRHELKAAQDVITQGVRAGADGPLLYDGLASVAQNDKDPELAETALQDSVGVRPSFTALMRLGMFYLDEAKYSRAALIMRRATASFPQSADAYFYLAVAEERDYRFSEAEKDFSRAVKLAPSNVGFRDHYADFEHKVAESVPASPPLSE
jgi:O-antigen ligase/tetratricopeptide (TPR) repeat protein